MRVMVLGGDGYLGWPTCMDLADSGHEILAVDNYLRRTIASQTDSEPLFRNPNLDERCRVFRELTGRAIETAIGDCRDFRFMEQIFLDFRPECVIHYAEQPSAPYSMRGFNEAQLTLINNLEVTLNLIWATILHAPDCHLVKLGTMGEYGTPNIDIEEGFINIEHKGRRDTFLFPRQAGSLYHTTKILDTDLLWFYVRTYGLSVTDLMQGPVYGIATRHTELDDRLLPNFHYDDIFGTVLNRFLVQATVGIPLTVYGKGGQRRGYINLCDTLQCVSLAVNHPAEAKQMRVFNQFTEVFSVVELAEMVREAGNELGMDVRVQHIDNPRAETEEHYYNPVNTGLTDLGLEPNLLTKERMVAMLKQVLRHSQFIDRGKVYPRVSWADHRTRSEE